MEYNISSKSILCYIIKKIPKIFLAGFLIGVLVAGITAFKSQYLTNIDSVKLEKKQKNLQLQAKELKDQIDDLTEYMDSALLFQFDADTVPTATANLRVSLQKIETEVNDDNEETEETESEDSDTVDAPSLEEIINKYKTDFLNDTDWTPFWKATETEVNSSTLDGCIVIDGDSSTGILIPTVYAETEEKAEALLEAVLDSMAEYSGNIIDTGRYQLQFELLSSALKIDSSSLVKSIQDSNNTKYNEILTKYDNCLAQIYNNSLSGQYHNILKNGLLGFAAGLVFMVILYYIIFCGKVLLFTAAEIKQVVGAPIITVYNRDKYLFRKIILLIQKETNNDREDILTRMQLNMNTYAEGYSNFLITGLTSGKVLQEIAIDVNNTIEDNKTVKCGNDICNNLSTLNQLSLCDSVIYLAKREKVKYEDIVSDVEIINSYNKKIVGIIVL